MAEKFDCCSHYVQCSTAGTCVFSGDEDYAPCNYRKKLTAGINFYAKKKTISLTRWQPDPVLYLECYDRHFKVNHLGHNGFSYPLNPEEFSQLQESFLAANIPFVLQAAAEKCIMEGDWAVPANAKVSFQLPGCEQMFSIGNFNACLILKRYADGITKALQKKGLSAQVELLGAYRSTTAQSATLPSNLYVSQSVIHITDSPRPAPALVSIAKFQQLSIFDLVSMGNT